MSRSRFAGPMAVALLVLGLSGPAAAVPATWTDTQVLPPAPIAGANGITIGPDGQLWVGSAGVGIYQVDPETGAIGSFHGPGGEWGADDLAFGPDGALYHTAIMNGTVGRLAPDGSHTILNATPLPGVNPIAFSDDGRLFVGTAFFGDALYEFDPTGATEPRLIVEGLGLNGFDWSDGVLWAPRMETGELVTVDPETGATTTIASGFTFPVSADVRSDGRVVVVDAGADQVVLVDPATGSQTLLAPNHAMDGLDNAAIGADGRLFVTDNDSGQIVEILDHGSVREVSPGGTTAGPGGVTCVRWGDTELVVAADLFDLHLVDVNQGYDSFTIPGGFTKPGMAGMPVTVGTLANDRLVTTSWFDRSVGIFDPIAFGNVRNHPYTDKDTLPINAVGFGSQIVVAELSPKGSRLAWMEPSNGARGTLAGMTLPTGIATDGYDLWAADWIDGTVAQILDDGRVIAPVVVARDLVQPEGLALLPDGTLAVAETGTGRLLQIDPATGDVTVIAEGLAMSPNNVPGQPPTGFFTGVGASQDGSVWVSADGLHRFTPGW